MLVVEPPQLAQSVFEGEAIAVLGALGALDVIFVEVGALGVADTGLAAAALARSDLKLHQDLGNSDAKSMDRVQLPVL